MAEACRRLPRLTVRVRLTALYSVLSLLTTGCWLTLLYLTLRERTEAKSRAGAQVLAGHVGGDLSGVHVVRGGSAADLAAARVAELSHLVLLSGVALVGLVAVAVAGGWLMAGRVLRPVHRISTAARNLSADDLAGRIALAGPDDELKELADTFDGFLSQLQEVVDAQRQFVANASHELRTPLTIQRALLQVALVAPTPEELAAARRDLLAVNRRSEQLIDSLLLLAQSQNGPVPAEMVALDELAADVTAEQAAFARDRQVSVRLRADPAVASGHPVLLRHLIDNLVRNATAYNRPGGTVEVDVEPGLLRVVNTGPAVPPETVPALFEPFRRLERQASGERQGSGLGLAIVRSIVQAHRGEVTAQANPGGGLTVEVRLAASGADAPGGPAATPARAGRRRRPLGPGRPPRAWWSRDAGASAPSPR